MKREKITDYRWLAGLLERATVDVARRRRGKECYIIPRIATEGVPERRAILNDMANLMKTKVHTLGPRRLVVMTEGFAPTVSVAKKVVDTIRDPANKCRMKRIIERSKKKNPTVCTKEEAEAPSGKLAEIYYKGCPKPLRA